MHEHFNGSVSSFGCFNSPRLERHPSVAETKPVQDANALFISADFDQSDSFANFRFSSLRKLQDATKFERARFSFRLYKQ
jgi:hypothetical protein